ncbi:MAG: molybdopterin-synthase adenylyltransferase MoeB [Nitrososphaerales archaeon]|jgi:adenylyltransferase/sulfurtransferase
MAANDRPRVSFSDGELERYNRHLIMPEVGLEGQRALKSSSVLLVGAGGLGAPAAIYLAAAGVGRIGIVDFDVIEKSNLHRQVLFAEKDIGRSKAEVIKERLLDINPNVSIELHKVRLDSSNAMEIMRGYDIVVDGTDNFPTRYLVNDACVFLGKPNVYASLFRFEGQVALFYAKEGPCYRCLYSEPPPPGLVPNCAEAGVLGVLPGIVGSIQAAEVIDMILGKGASLVGRLLLIDALDMKFREVRLKKNPGCAVCGENPTVKELIDYEVFCGIREEREPGLEIGPVALKQALVGGGRVVLVDVRSPAEARIARIEGSTLIPLDQLMRRVNELNPGDPIVVYCHTGMRSGQAAKLLRGAGFKNVKNLKGGIQAWTKEVDPTLRQY